MKQLKKTLHLSGSQDKIAKNFRKFLKSLKKVKGDAILDTANKIYVKKGSRINADFEKVAVESFKSEVESIKFIKSKKAANTINKWVEEHTNDLIKNFISPSLLNGATEMVLVNAIYFKGLWKYPFNEQSTTKGQFYTDDDNSVQLDFMTVKNKFNYGENDELESTVLELQYLNSDISLLIVLPKNRNGLQEVEKKLSSDFDLANVLDQLSLTQVQVSLPKYKVEYKVDLVEVLQKVNS